MSLFTIFPAIDLRHGQVVRLQQGDPARQSTYSTTAVDAALRWRAVGAQWVHVVNLDGSFGDEDKARANRAALRKVCALGQLHVQTGGGLRSMDDISAAMEAGAKRVVLGTAAVENPALVSEAIKRYGSEAVVIGLDSKEGMIVTRGWQNSVGIMASELGLRMRDLGVIHALYTEVGRDGLMKGAAAELTGALAQLTGLRVIASGGVGTLKDIEEVALYKRFGVCGVVVGKALYEHCFKLEDALRLSNNA